MLIILIIIMIRTFSIRLTSIRLDANPVNNPWEAQTYTFNINNTIITIH